MPIFTLQRVEGRLFRPMALTVAFALLGALTFSILIAPVLASKLFSKGVRERHNPVMAYVTDRYRKRVRWALEHRWTTVSVGLAALAITLFLAFSGIIGSEFLPHDFVKVVPCGHVGGHNYIRDLKAMFPSVPLIAAGAVNQLTAFNFIHAGAIALGIGGELIPREAIRRRQPDRIAELARRFTNSVSSARAQ
jgi:hypothetical protein